ncbi:cell wall elongation regulator TseB-like domain-containing protein [Alkalihalobacterium elongatum]|uniref:cell wall elongation regulator TseB-like domain-containing protein n=1 Tax=Alkalihalobacterium elongatum TaxID=2675466 RepID=UPI001C1FF42B|nr:DUF5590 domain-containing protein [Alkalihalobacterium elongatum]
MKKWVITCICLLVFAAIGISSYFYQTMRSPITEQEQLAIERALNETELSVVDDVSFYHGTEPYIVVKGRTDQDDTGLIAWVGEEERIIVKNVADGLSKEEVRHFAQNELAPKELISVRLGIENRLPIYEITYIDENDRYSFYYITFEEGTFVKRYSLKTEG